MKEIYEFDERDAYRFASSIGANIRRKGNELTFAYCPLCQGGRKRDKNTFSINLQSGLCSCLRSSCSYKGNMITLARDFGFELTDGVMRYYNINNFNAKFKKFKDAHRETTDRAVTYLANRGIDAEIVRKYELTTKTGEDGILVFPFRNEYGELKFIKYRNMDFVKGVSEGGKEWCEANCMPILFGMQQCDLDDKTLIITEGQIDSLSVVQAGFKNAVSVPTGMNGFTWVPHCWDWIHQFEKIIVFADYENGQMTLLDEISRRFNLQIYHVRFEDYKDCKDANDILQKYGPEQIAKCIKNAKAVAIQNIVDLSDVRPVNSYEVEKLRTGLSCLDKLLHGGLPFGGVTLITGKAGEGKSTLASQFMVEALEQGYRSFVYSGELTNSSYKEGFYRQIAGVHVEKYQINNEWHDVRYKVSDLDWSRINEWVGNKCFIYSDNLSENTKPVCTVIEEAIQQYSVRVVLIDNLMTAMDYETDGADKYEKQSNFMKRVTALAIKYNVLILLVAHKRKISGDNGNDNISGSADIGNLGSVNISYERGDNKTATENQRLIKLYKNRLFGTIDSKGTVMDFSEGSKRIYGPGDDSEKEYKWVVEDDDFIDRNDLALELPF